MKRNLDNSLRTAREHLPPVLMGISEVAQRMSGRIFRGEEFYDNSEDLDKLVKLVSTATAGLGAATVIEELKRQEFGE